MHTNNCIGSITIFIQIIMRHCNRVIFSIHRIIYIYRGNYVPCLANKVVRHGNSRITRYCWYIWDCKFSSCIWDTNLITWGICISRNSLTGNNKIVSIAGYISPNTKTISTVKNSFPAIRSKGFGLLGCRHKLWNIHMGIHE